MNPFCIRQATLADVPAIVKIYNSNAKFLKQHLGVTLVNETFIAEEMLEMESANFLSCVIADIATNKIIGTLDYRIMDTAYLSLMMIDSDLHGKRVGVTVYGMFEEMMLQAKCHAIRIDVVNDYDDNVVGFWAKQGFVIQESIELSWGSKTSAAVKMVKVLV